MVDASRSLGSLCVTDVHPSGVDIYGGAHLLNDNDFRPPDN